MVKEMANLTFRCDISFKTITNSDDKVKYFM